MIRVAQVIWSGNFGGIERLAIDLCMAQKKNPQLQVELIVAKYEGEYLEKLSELNIIHHNLKLKSGFDFSFSKYNALKNLFQKFDIIHLHFFNPMIAYAAVQSGRKIAYTEHGNFGFGREKKISDIVNNFFLKKFLNKHVNYISFNSKFTEQVARDRYHLLNTNCEVVYNGIDFSDTSSESTVDDELKKKLEGKFVVGTSSRFAGFKRIDRLLNAFAEFQENKNTVLLLVGDGILRNDLEQLARQLNISERTIFTGYRKDVRQLQQMMDVCVFPSENEPFGLVAIETLALGKPVIVFNDGGGIAELIEQVSPQDIVHDNKSLVKRMEFYFNHRDEILNGVNKRIQFAKLFDIKIMEEKFFQIYKSMI